MTALALFASCFALVFFLGLQSLNVNRGHYAAALNSFGIGTGNLVLLKLAPESNGIEIAAFLCGGPIGICAAMWMLRRYHRRTTPR